MQTATSVLERVETTPEVPLVHTTWCCDDDRLMCATPDAHDMDWATYDEETSCVVCDDLERLGICPGCGEEF